MSSKTTFSFDRFMDINQTRETSSRDERITAMDAYAVKRGLLNKLEINTEMGKVFQKYLVITFLSLSLSRFEVTGIPWGKEDVAI